MNIDQVLRLLTGLEQLMHLALDAGLSISTLAGKIEAARAEGRQLSDDEINGMAAKSQAAIDTIRG